MPASMSSPGVFTWGHVFQHGDLPIFVTDTSGNPLSPFSVKYSMYYTPKNATCPVRVGPLDRTPVQIDVGEYYATGVAGQCGQPGDWCVEWKIQEFFDGPWISETFCFKVFDSSQFCAGGSSTSSNCSSVNTPACNWCCRAPCSCTTSPKYGW